MPKTTAQGWGAEGTNALEPDYLEKQEEKWAGISSSKSSKSKGNAKPKKRPGPQKRALTTVPPLKKDPEASSTAGSTDGPGKVDEK